VKLSFIFYGEYVTYAPVTRAMAILPESNEHGR